MKKILLIRLSSLGDVILTTGLCKYLKEHTDTIVDILTYKEFAPFLAYCPYIDNIIVVERRLSFFEYINFIQEEIEGYDFIVDLQGKLKTGLLRFTTDATYFTYSSLSFKRRMYAMLGLFENQLKRHVAERYFAPFRKIFDLRPSLEELRPFLTKLPLTEKLPSGYILIHPFASRYTKIWPKFPYLVERLNNSGIIPVVIGKGAFASKGEYIDKTGELKACELISLISGAKLLVTTDSGPMHIAVSTKTPLVAIFGSTTREFGFYPFFDGCHIVEKDIKCRPCHVHGLSSCPKKHFRCMEDISVDDVVKVIDGVTR